MNNNITEDFCSFEVSKLLKEKGFNIHDDEIIKRAWIKIINGGWSFTSFGTEDFDEYKDWLLVRRCISGYVLSEDWENYVPAPTHAIAIKWIRENFDIHIYTSKNLAVNWYWIIYDITKSASEKFTSIETTEEMSYNLSEVAIEAALLYTLKNLIK